MNAVLRSWRTSLERFRFVRSLRFRVVAGFLVFFTLMLSAVGFIFREMLISILYGQTAQALEEEWGGTKGYLRIEHQRPLWYFDRFDPEESLIVSRMQRVYVITDANGIVLEVSSIYRNLGVDRLVHIQQVLRSPEPVLEVRKDDTGTPYLVRQGAVLDDKHRLYFLAIGRSMADGMRTVNKFAWRYFALMPLLVVLAAVLGWHLAGRGLRPLHDFAATAHQITGSNLNVQIPLRNAGDELDELVEAFNRMIERLNLSFEQIRQFSTDVSHELRTPLTAIRGQLEVALFTAKTTEQYQDAMVNALQDVEQLSNIIRALLLLSQAESGQLALQLHPVNLTDVARDMADQYQIPAEASAIELNTQIQNDCWIRADKTQMERLLSNLLSNAIKYTPQGGQVTLRTLRLPDGKVGIEVEDTGIGIAAENLPHIFDRFYRVRASHSTAIQGLGLGLSFVSWIVNAHGGSIDVRSHEGRGTCFCVSLPPAEPAPMPASPPAVVSESLPG